MRFHWMKILVAAVLVAASVQVAAQQAKPSADEQAGNSALAERLAQLAQLNLARRTIEPATLRQSAAMLEQACALDPAEVRFPRLLSEAYLQLLTQLEKQGQPMDEARDGAIAALTRIYQLQPDDQATQIKLFDLYYSKLETADQRQKYLSDRLSNEAIAPEVRSYLAVMAAKLAMERAAVEQSGQYIEQALSLCPLNPEALRMKYQQLPPDTTAAQRAAVLLQMLRSNPAQPTVMTELAGVVADVGLVDPSLTWYGTSFAVSQRMGMAPDFGQLTAYTAQLVIADQHQVAEGYAQKLLERDPGNADAAFLSLLVARRGGDAAKTEAAAGKARSAVLTRLNQISDLIHQREPVKPDAAAAAAPPAAPQISEDVKKLQEVNNSEATIAYAAGLADLAWIDIYFNSKPADAQPYLDALKQMLPADSATVARLEGWSYLADGKKDEARVKLSAVADRDPLAALGMIRIEGGNDLSPARELLSKNAAGLIGAMLIEALRDRIGLMPAAPAAADVRTELDAFPREWLDILDFTKVKSFYAFKAEPLQVGHSFGEPILVRVTLANTSNYDITIGANGTIRPDLWFDVQIKGLVQQYLPGVAFERLGGKVVLKPRDYVSQVVRVDQGNLAGVLAGNPQVGIPLFFSVLTNPITQQTGIAPGPAGYRVQLSRVVERSSAPLKEETLQKLYQQLQNGNGAVRLRTLDLLGTFAAAMKQREDAALQAKAAELADVVRKSTGDPVASVRAEALFVTAMLSDATAREGIIRQMLADPEPAVRALGLDLLQQAAPPAGRKELAAPLAERDADPIIKKLAASVIEVADLPPPATQPAPEAAAGAGQP